MPQRFLGRATIAGTALLAAVQVASCDGDTGTGQPATPAPASRSATFNSADVRFATEMIGHHQQVVEMARLAEAGANNAQVRDLAARIRQAQDPEIATMSRLAAAMGAAGAVARYGPRWARRNGGRQEMKDLMSASGTNVVDRMFLQMMIRHHRGAVHMATTEQQQGQDPHTKQLAAKIASDQTAEITKMQDLLTRL